VGARRKNSLTPSSDRVGLQSVQFASNSIDHLPTHYIVGIFPLI
jgi:hypothetical protein